MKSVFVRGLWGDELTQSRPARFHHTLMDEVRETREWQYRESPTEVYCFGERNRDELAKIGYEAVMIHPDAVLNYTGATERNCSGNRGWRNYGADMSRQKFECLKAALEHADAAVWLDWDVRLIKPLPKDFWGRINSGGAIQAPLGKGYKNKQCPWRAVQPRILHHTFFLYVRDLSVAERLLQVAAAHSQEYDEPIVGRVFDEVSGGWQGTDAYKRDGYEPYCCGFCSPVFMVHQPEEEVFRCCGK